MQSFDNQIRKQILALEEKCDELSQEHSLLCAKLILHPDCVSWLQTLADDTGQIVIDLRMLITKLKLHIYKGNYQQ